MRQEFEQESFEASRLPSWSCPTCGRGILRCIDGLRIHEDSVTKEESGNEYWEYEYNKYVFHGLLSCGECKEAVLVIGKGHIEHDSDRWREEASYVQWLTPCYFTPPLKIIRPLLDEETPEVITDLLTKAFELFWCDPDSCLNRLRAVVEQILNGQGVRNRRAGGGFISLAERIGNFNDSRYSHVKDALTAAKHMGNDGSHGFSEATREDLLDAFAVIEYCLLQFYPRKPEREVVNDIVARINENKGIRKKFPIGPVD